MNAPFRFSLFGAAALCLLYACSNDSGSGSGNTATTSTSIGVNGGTVQAGALMLDIPGGALGESLEITVEQTSAISTPPGWTKLGPAFDLGPDGTQFAMPVAVTIDLAAVSTAAKTPVLYHSSDGKSWSAAESSAFDESAQQVTGSIRHFSYVASFAAGSDAGIAGSGGMSSGGTGGAVSGGATGGGVGTSGTASAGAPDSAGAAGAPAGGTSGSAGSGTGGSSACNCCCGQTCVAGMCVAPAG